jgi:DNA polymerase-4
MRGIIGHIWLPGFYSSVEMRTNESVSNGAVFAIVKGHRILDISPEARRKGIRPGMTWQQAYIVCPELVRIEYTPERYSGFADTIWEICAKYSPAVEPLDETEAFIELSFCPNITDALDELSRHVEGFIGVLPSYGIARSKLIARILSGVLPEARTEKFLHLTEHMISSEGKSIGAKVVPGGEEEFLKPLPVNLLWPLDEDILSYLCRLGVGSIGELQRMGQSVLVDMLGEVGYVIYQYSQGVDYSQVSAVFPQNGVTFSKAFDSPVSDWHALSAITSEGASHLMGHQDLAYMAVRRVEIALKCDNGHTVSCKKHLVKPVGMYGGLQRLCGHLLNEIFVTGHLHAPVEAVSISVYGSSPKKTGGQIDMLFPSRFSPYRAQASDEVMDEVICKVRERFGPGTVFPGREWKLTRRDKLFLASEGYIYEEGKRIASCCNGR